ncbi:MAG TPA: glycoside hydrolase family 44 protein [Thermoanaerobaculia bacterium]|nr:glycoside hydrolase family 44 protein [Thermoanaerobaculia bacterium]
MPARRPITLMALAFPLLTVAAAPRKPVVNVNPAATINVDAAANRHAIDPRIYGVAFADAATLADLSIPINRWGGNTTSRYNWANSTANHARDYFFENVPDDAPNGGGNGESADLFIQPTLNAGAQPIMTIPVLGYLPSARGYACGYSIMKYAASGCCLTNDAQFRPDCGDGFHNVTGEPLKHVNDPLDIEAVYPSSHQGNWVQHNIDTFGSAATTGVKYYAIDNEPGLWDSTHFDIHPDYSTYDEIWSKTQEYGALIKSKDPSALVSAVEEWGWLSYFDSAVDYRNLNTADRNAHGGVNFVDWMLQQAHTYEQAHGVRIVDILSLHWYPQGKKGTTLNEYDPNHPDQEVTVGTKTLRNQSTRSLWDPNYIEQSWIQDVGPDNGIARLIPRMHDWVANNYPGTQIGITEYNWGAESDPNGATAQADILGIFGREALDLAARWTSPPAGSNVYNAFKMYRNYDGAHSKFGDISVSASGPDPDNVSTFAALRSSDGALTVMVIAKYLTDTTPVTVNLANDLPSGPAHVWQLQADNAIHDLGTMALAGSSVSLTVPQESVTLLVIPGSYLNAPGNVVATATSTSTATVTWSAVAGAASYQVYRSSMNGAYALAGPSVGTTFNDAALGANTTFLYKVRAVSGAAVSPFSSVDPATTIMFTDDPLAAGTIAKTVHIDQLRTAVNAMRDAAGLGHQVFTDDPIVAGTAIQSVHLTQLRSALDQARAAMGVAPLVYTDPAITAGFTTIKAAHITDLRNGVK